MFFQSLMQPVPTAPTAAEDNDLSTPVLHMARLHAKRPLLVGTTRHKRPV